jgi:16S rRNA U516 pseudouridylate synthase RsuA-like enzyme
MFADTHAHDTHTRHDTQKLEKTPPPQVWLHYKKRGVLVTHHDPQGREALFPHLRNMGLPHLVSVVRPFILRSLGSPL